MAVFCQLSDPRGYRPCDWDLLADPTGREYWLNEFRDHCDGMLAYALARESPPERRNVEAMRQAYRDALDHLRREPDARGRLDVLELCILRDEFLERYEIGDPYADVKRRENEASLRLYPTIIERLDRTSPARRVEPLIRGVLAGNRFDLGSPTTAADYRSGGMDFLGEMERLAPRPWFADDLDRIAPSFRRGPERYESAIIFADNAGADIVLGVLPVARHLAEVGTRVVLAATDHYALNDITRPELESIIESASRMDERVFAHVAAGMIRVVGTGHGHPLIDLSNVSEECNQAAANCDLIVLEGMGRAVESNYRTPFRVDCIRLAMVKNEAVADHYGCKLFDLICRLSTAR